MISTFLLSACLAPASPYGMCVAAISTARTPRRTAPITACTAERQTPHHRPRCALCGAERRCQGSADSRAPCTASHDLRQFECRCGSLPPGSRISGEYLLGRLVVDCAVAVCCHRAFHSPAQAARTMIQRVIPYAVPVRRSARNPPASSPSIQASQISTASAGVKVSGSSPCSSHNPSNNAVRPMAARPLSKSTQHCSSASCRGHAPVSIDTPCRTCRAHD